MFFRQLFDRESGTLSYLMANEQGEAVLVDPVLEQVERDLQLIKSLGFTLKILLETHVHADHITGAAKLRKETAAKILVPSGAGVEGHDGELKDQDRIILSDLEIAVISTPGHTSADVCYFVNEQLLLTGDALLVRGCGRTDFQSGNAGQLYDGITEQLFTLPDDIKLYPGHAYNGLHESTIGEEKSHNPRLTKPRKAFIELMNSLNLPLPKKIDIAVPANLKCGCE